MTLARRRLGARGEELAAELLERGGARVLARNARTRFGELDLLADEHGTLVGVEVKTRHADQPALPEEAVSPARLARLERLLTSFALQHGYEDAPWRVDVVSVEVSARGEVVRLDRLRSAYYD